jgi:hypothetical protein
MGNLAPLKDQLLETEKWLLDELGFRITNYSYSPRAMGGSSVKLESEALRLVFLRDRGFTWAQVAPVAEPSAWWDVSLVLEAVTGVRPHCGTELHDAAVLFRDNHTVLTHAMGPGWAETKRELDRRYEILLKEAMTPKPVTLKNRLLLTRLLFQRRLPLLAFAIVVVISIWIISR